MKLLGRGRGALVISTAEILLQPNVKADKQIAAAHFLDLQFRSAAAPVPPGNRNRRPTVAAHNRLQRNLDREVEMRGDQRLAPVDYFPPIRLESVSRVVELDPEEEL